MRDEIEVFFTDLLVWGTVLLIVSGLAYLCGLDKAEPVFFWSGIGVLLSAVVIIANAARGGGERSYPLRRHLYAPPKRGFFFARLTQPPH